MIYFLVLVALVLGVAVFLYQKGKIKDHDGDGDIDLDDLKVTAKEIEQDIKEGVREIKEVIEDVSEVVSFIKGKVTKSKLNSLTKQQLIDSAKADHKVDLDSSAKKSVLVNKVYSLYNKK